MLEINYTCSFGSLCHSAQILKRNNLKLCSYPFDWVFSGYSDIIHCIEDNFNIFLDKSYYTDLSNLKLSNPAKCGHSKYDKNMFNHHDPLNNLDDYNYFVRCVDRFKKLLQKQEHKLFVMILPNRDNVDENTKKNIIDFNNKLSKYTNNYTLLVIFHIPNKKKNHNIFTYNDNIHFLELHTLSVSNGVHFKNNDDNIYLDNIIKSKYNFNLKII